MYGVKSWPCNSVLSRQSLNTYFQNKLNKCSGDRIKTLGWNGKYFHSETAMNRLIFKKKNAMKITTVLFPLGHVYVRGYDVFLRLVKIVGIYLDIWKSLENAMISSVNQTGEGSLLPFRRKGLRMRVRTVESESWVEMDLKLNWEYWLSNIFMSSGSIWIVMWRSDLTHKYL